MIINSIKLLRLSLMIAMPVLLSQVATADEHKYILPQSNAALPVKARISERIFGLPGLSNVGRIAPGILRGAQPGPQGYETLKSLGVRTVINFRAQHSEKARVEAAGLRSIEYPVSMLEMPTKSQIKTIVSTIADPANQPVYIHCALGKDRTGIIVAAYRMDIDGWTLQDAMAEMEAFGFNDAWIHLKQFIREYSNHK